MHSQRKPFGFNIAILIVTLFTLFPLVLASPSIPIPIPPPTSNPNETKALEKRQMSAGSSCSGSEGQWNCLTNQWQRCAAGQWSEVMDCAAGTMCTPSGLTYDFAVQFANGAAGGGAATSDAAIGSRNLITDRMSLAILGEMGLVIALLAR
ncbi:hypothetical protein M426DRAFT_325026 [Hypoxylon sp. CI-4A]|nr:hypothetical protein M426DRAFT_325026 [Hypoxylon sp. CI-4A]